MAATNSPRALWHLSSAESRLLPTTSAAPVDGVRVRAAYSLISTGTERLVACGQVPLSLYDTMRVPHQEGTFAFPLTYGYSWVGRVDQPGHQAHGRWVHLLHPHQDWAHVAPSDWTLVPEDIPPLRASLASNLETAVNAVWEVPVSLGDRVLVMGFGIIGSLLARLLTQLPGVDLAILETQTARRELAIEMGFELADSSPRTPYDVVFNTTARAAALQHGLDHLGREGALVELSWYGQQSIELRLGAAFHQRRQRLISSQVSQLPPARRPRWDYQRRKALVFELLRQAHWDAHLRECIAFEALPDFFEQLRAGHQPMLGVAVDYGQE
ncbi:MAG: zinc-binding alcohol dehydrogenase [Bacteroidota bacterium]